MKDLTKGYIILISYLIGIVSFTVAARHLPEIKFSLSKE